MTRKEFIITLIEKKLKPLIYLLVLAYFVIYIFNIVNNNTNNDVNSIFNLLLVISIIFFVLGVIKYIIDSITYNLPNSAKKILVNLSKFLNTISFIGLFFIAYFSYTDGKLIQTILILSAIIYLTYTKIKIKQ